MRLDKGRLCKGSSPFAHSNILLYMTNPIQRVYEIAEDGNFSRSSSAKTPELHWEMQKVMSSLAPCQLPEFLTHKSALVRGYARSRMEKIERS